MRTAAVLCLVAALAACGGGGGGDPGPGDLPGVPDPGAEVPGDPGADPATGDGAPADPSADPSADPGTPDPGKDPGPPPPANTPPRLGPIPPLSLDMGKSASVDLNPLLADDEQPESTLELSWSTPHVALSDPGDHVLRVVAPVDWFGVEPIEITVTDGGGLTASSTLTVTVNEVTVAPPPPPPDECGQVTFAYAAGTGSHVVLLSGSFNGWASSAPAADALTDPDGDGTWTVDRVLDPGVHQYKFIVDGQWKPDPDNPNQTPDGFGGINSVLRIDPCEDGRR